MRSITQSIILDRLEKALATRGVDLKRSTVLEIASEAFGFNDGNAFVAAMKEGRFDPPVASLSGGMWDEGQNLSIFHDPVANGLFAVDPGRLPQKSRKGQMIVSPYGGLLLMPTDQVVEISQFTQPESTNQNETPEVIYVANNRGGSLDEDVDQWRHLLLPYGLIKIERSPVYAVTGSEMARVNGKLHFAFTYSEEYDSHADGILAIRSLSEYVREHEAPVKSLGGMLRYHDNIMEGATMLELLLPVEVAKNVDNLADWHDAVAILLGAERDNVMARFHPQAWSNDYAIDVYAEGDPDYNIAVDILLMGTKAASDVKDDNKESDDLRFGLFAPEWVKNWNGPFYVECQDNIIAFLEHRKAEQLSENMKNCIEGLHSWVHEKGRLNANTKCKHCDETYGCPE